MAGCPFCEGSLDQQGLEEVLWKLTPVMKDVLDKATAIHRPYDPSMRCAIVQMFEGLRNLIVNDNVRDGGQEVLASVKEIIDRV